MDKTEIDEVKISKAIIETYVKDLLDATETEVAIAIRYRSQTGG